MTDKKKYKVVVIGGGTGTVSILNGIKKYKDLDISVIVSMTDDGGRSNAMIRDEFGVLPLSDIRKSLIALAKHGNSTFRELFTYRFSKGTDLKSHTLGNLIMLALTEITGSEVEAVKACERIFQVLGHVIPVTTDDVRLVAKYSDGSIVKGEHWIDEPLKFNEELKIEELMTDPDADANPEAIEAIKSADFIVAGPGDLFTSTIANIIIDGIPDVLSKAKGKYVFVSNLMTKMGQTHWMKHSDLVKEIGKYSNRMPDLVLLNNQEIPKDILRRYEEDREFVIEDDIDDKKVDYIVLRRELIGDRIIKRKAGDDLKRSLVRHDSDTLAKVLYEEIITK